MDLLNFLQDKAGAQEARNAQARASEEQTQLAELRRQHDELKQLTRALWALLKETQGLTEADLKRHLLSTQAAAKGQTARFWTCGSCRHEVPVAVTTCPYCGLEVERDEAF